MYCLEKKKKKNQRYCINETNTNKEEEGIFSVLRFKTVFEMKINPRSCNRNLSNCELAIQEMFAGLQRDSNPSPPRWRCSALPAEL